MYENLTFKLFMKTNCKHIELFNGLHIFHWHIMWVSKFDVYIWDTVRSSVMDSEVLSIYNIIQFMIACICKNNTWSLRLNYVVRHSTIRTSEQNIRTRLSFDTKIALVFHAMHGKITHHLIYVYQLLVVIIWTGPIFYHLPPITWEWYQLMEEHITNAMSSLIGWYRDMTKKIKMDPDVTEKHLKVYSFWLPCVSSDCNIRYPAPG